MFSIKITDVFRVSSVTRNAPIFFISLVIVKYILGLFTHLNKINNYDTVYYYFYFR